MAGTVTGSPMLRFVSLSLGVTAGIFGFTAAAAFTSSRVAAALIAAAVTGLVTLIVHRRPPIPLDEAAGSRGLKIVSGLSALAAILLLARTAVFMVDPSQVAFSQIPSSRWEIEHSCLSAYFVAAEASSTEQSVYDQALYSMPDDDPVLPRKARMIGPFKVDVFEYPPPFLLMPRALRLLTPDFLDLRALWFAISGGVLLVAVVVVARFMGPSAGTRALLLAPLVWVSVGTIGTLQKGNVQILVIAASMLAMALFAKRRFAAGGALLAFVTLSKLYPGLLIVYLLTRRQWRALGWTAALGAGFLALSLLDTGWSPYGAFLGHLPGLVGGEAFPAFRRPAAMAINFSVPGLVFKLQLFGVPGMGFGAAKIVGWAYTLVALAATLVAGLRARSDEQEPPVWMAILILATLRSPFLPQTYAAFPPIWLLTLLATTRVPTVKTLSLVVLVWAALNVYWPTDWPIDPRLLATASALPQAVTILLAALALKRRPGTAAA